MDLSGTWRACPADEGRRRTFPHPDADDRDWVAVTVPGHWRDTDTFAAADGPLLYRRRFHAATPDPGRRAWLTFDGLFYQGDVWLDGSYLGDTEGYFAPHTFEVTAPLSGRRDHLLAVEVACHPQVERAAKRNLTGVFQHWDCIDVDWNPGGIWAPVRLWHTGPVRIASLRVTCPDASPERATLELVASLDAAERADAALATTVVPVAGAGGPSGPVAQHTTEQVLAPGRNQVRWRVAVEHPQLWWPRTLGPQPRHRVEVAVSTAGAPSDRREVVTGLRQVRMRNFVVTVNGERLFCKGANLGPTRRDPAAATPEEVAADVDHAVGAGLDLLRVHAHVARPELYDAADRAGLLLWQDLPLQWGYRGVRREAMRQARHAVDLLGHHPSIAMWCGHNAPFAVDHGDPPLRAGLALRQAAGQVLPTANKTILDGSVKRTLERTDGSRPVVAHSGVLPHPTGGTDSHLYFGWYHGRDRDLAPTLARLPVLARWVSEFGAQAVPDSDEFLDPERWPDLDWDHLGRAHGLQKAVFDRRVPPADHPSLAAWRAATQAYQADLIRFHVETLRRLKYRPAGGFCQFMLADAQPAVSWSVLDHRRRPKDGYRALAAACAPVIVVADRPAEGYRPGERLSLDVHVVSDLRAPLTGAVIEAVLEWPGGDRRWRFTGDVGADSCARVGRLRHRWASDVRPGPVELTLRLSAEGGPGATNRYHSVLAAPAPSDGREPGGRWRTLLQPHDRR